MAERAELIKLTDHRPQRAGDTEDAAVSVDGDESEIPRRSRRRLVWAVVILSMVAVAGVAWWVGASTQ